MPSSSNTPLVQAGYLGPVLTPAVASALPKLVVFAGQVTVEQYWMGRDKNPAYADQVTDALRANAAQLVDRINPLLSCMRTDGVAVYQSPATRSVFTSGWRPAAINAVTPGAAALSKHMFAQAGDLYDPHGELDDWCMGNQDMLASIGLWLEHPSATKGWCHVQDVPPRSLNRVFYP